MATGRSGGIASETDWKSTSQEDSRCGILISSEGVDFKPGIVSRGDGENSEMPLRSSISLKVYRLALKSASVYSLPRRGIVIRIDKTDSPSYRYPFFFVNLPNSGPAERAFPSSIARFTGSSRRDVWGYRTILAIIDPIALANIAPILASPMGWRPSVDMIYPRRDRERDRRSPPLSGAIGRLSSRRLSLAVIVADCLGWRVGPPAPVGFALSVFVFGSTPVPVANAEKCF